MQVQTFLSFLLIWHDLQDPPPPAAQVCDVIKFVCRANVKAKKFKNPFIFGLLVKTCYKNLVIWIFFNIYQIKAIISKKNLVYMTKLDFQGWKNTKICIQ
jgi:hypothetical protein